MTTRLPLWFRSVMVAFFTVLLVAYFLVNQGVENGVHARGLFDRMARQYSPLLGLQASLPDSRLEPTRGAYTVNGMRVAYKTIPSPGSIEQVFPVLQEKIELAGFKAKVLTIQDAPTLVGLHPHTKVMVSFRPVRAADGRLYLRVSQQNLGDVKPGFVAELPGIPTLPGAHDPLLVDALKGDANRSLMYSAPGSPQPAADFYRRELSVRGWEQIQPPAAPPANLMATLFFRRLGEECSVVLLPGGEGEGVVVFVSIDKAVTGGKAHA